jgi:prepilin-type processing-associated H-X9-DG protein
VYEPDRRGSQRSLWLVLGIGCGCLVLLTLVGLGILVPVLVPVFSRSREAAQRATCAANMHLLANSLRLYQLDWNGRFPPAATWRTGLANYAPPDPKVWHCPADHGIHPSSYAFNANLSGLKRSDLPNPAGVVVLFETTSPAANPADLGQSWPNPGRHVLMGARGMGNNVAYADGHAETKVNLQPSDLAPKPAPTP